MILTEFCEKSKVVSSDFSMTKDTVVPLFSSSLPIKLIFCFKSGSSNLIQFVCLNLLQLIYNALKNIQYLTNYP